MTKIYPPTPPEWASTTGEAGDTTYVLPPTNGHAKQGWAFGEKPSRQFQNWVFFKAWKSLVWASEKVRRVDGPGAEETALEVEGGDGSTPGARLAVEPGDGGSVSGASVISLWGRIKGAAHMWLQAGDGGDVGAGGKPLLLRIFTQGGVTPWTHAQGGEAGLHLYHGGVAGSDPDSLPTSCGLSLINALPSDDANTRDSTIQCWGVESGGTKRRIGWLRAFWDDTSGGRGKLELRAWSGTGSADGVATLRGDGRFTVAALQAEGDVVSEGTLISVAINTGAIDAGAIDAASLAAPVVRAPAVPWALARVEDGGTLPIIGGGVGVSAVVEDGADLLLTLDPPLPSTDGLVIANERSGLSASGTIVDASTVRIKTFTGAGAPLGSRLLSVSVWSFA